MTSKGILRKRFVRRRPVAGAFIGGLMLMALGLSSFSVCAAAEEEGILLVAASDTCGEHFPRESGDRDKYDKVADLVEASGTDYFFAVGDLQHDCGILEDYLTYYDSEFGRLRDVTYPVPGNHDYYFDSLLYGTMTGNPSATQMGSGYLEYFEDRLAQISENPDSLKYSYYSFDAGNVWHVIALNSQIALNFDPAEAGSPAWTQYQWLLQDLVDHPNDAFKGTIAYFHHPMYNWEQGAASDIAEPGRAYIWEALDTAGVDIVLSGHCHANQRWEPQDAYGNYNEDGIRQFVVGAGGYYLDTLGHPPQPTNYVWGQDREFGALELTLYDGSCEFEFVSIDGEILDSGTVECR